MNIKINKINPFGVVVSPENKKTSIKNLDIGLLRNLFLEHQLVVLRGFQTFENDDDFSSYCESWGEISVWPFGKVLNLVQHDDPKDHIFDHSYIPLHWDGMFRPQVPEIQIFHCVKAPLSNHGGKTTFSNTILALKNTPLHVTERLKLIVGKYKRKMEFYDSVTVSPLITKHPYRDFLVIRYNEGPSFQKGRFINPSEISFVDSLSESDEPFQKTIMNILYSPQNYYAHEWQESDLVIADNFSLLHGREEFISKSPRHIQRVQVLSDPPFNNPSLESYK